jgi:hypothetical protein
MSSPKSNSIRVQISVSEDTQPEVYAHLKKFKGRRRGDAVKMALQKSVCESNLAKKVVAAMPSIGQQAPMHHPYPYPPQAHAPQAQMDATEEKKKEDLTFLDEIDFNPDEDFGDFS